jgi:hypothetical protein
MKKLFFSAALMTIIGLAGAQSVEAQGGGLGAILDYIHRLSGPRMVGPAATGWVSLGEVPRLRLSVARRWSWHYEGAVLPEGRSVRMWSFQPALEARIKGPLFAGGGVAVHSFDGDFAERFTHVSYPVYAQLRFPARAGVQAVVSGGYHIFPAFPEDAFGDLETGVSKTAREGSLWFGVGFEVLWY